MGGAAAGEYLYVFWCGESRSPVLSPGSKEPRCETVWHSTYSPDYSNSHESDLVGGNAWLQVNPD